MQLNISLLKKHYNDVRGANQAGAAGAAGADLDLPTFEVMVLQRTLLRPEVELDRQTNVTLLMNPYNMSFRLTNGKSLLFLSNGNSGIPGDQRDIVTYDDGEAEEGQENLEPPSAVATLTIYEGRESLNLEFTDVPEKRRFIRHLQRFLNLRMHNIRRFDAKTR
ncbi:hypothetical protein Zmor_024726 [Zophobas morio]|uniref:Uncharacterized protein n=1 Tax=Zophobas morio TaxID=2755281 RepID=A0AA38M8C2_9CUCU|nr:hypothetical protein Zmor_024726 [Zophobas morio]